MLLMAELRCLERSLSGGEALMVMGLCGIRSTKLRWLTEKASQAEQVMSVCNTRLEL